MKSQNTYLCLVGGYAPVALLEREVQIIRYLALGMSNKEIADELSYTEKTVKNYLSVIFQKLHLRNRTQVALFALRHGLLPDDGVTSYRTAQ